MRLLALVLVASALAATGCTSIDSTDATRDPDFLITESPDIDEPYTPMGFIRVEKLGWYLFAVLPIFSVTLDELVWEKLVPEAKERGADGIVNFKYEMYLASFWRFQILGAVPVPDWSQKGVVTGMAIKRDRKKGRPEKTQPGRE